jgi:hypothetical protein
MSVFRRFLDRIRAERPADPSRSIAKRLTRGRTIRSNGVLASGLARVDITEFLNRRL